MILDQFCLKGKIALVTGANDGIGQAIAVGLAEAGADIAAVYRSDITKTQELVEALGRRFFAVRADLSQMESVEKVYSAVMEHYGRIDILFNNAGAIRREDSLHFTEKDWDDVMNLNIKTLFFLTQRVAGQMIRNQIPGKIVNTASLLSFQGGIRTPSYTASKSAVRGITMTLANEWAQYGIQVNAIAPGFFITEQNRTLLLNPDGSYTERSKTILAHTPYGRFGEPSELLGTLQWLASDASKFVSGTMTVIDGGFDAFSI